MDAIFVDRHGNKKNFLYQYDHGQFLVIENFEYDVAPKVQYSVSTVPVAISTSSTLNNGVLTASIPDSLLCVGYDMIAYLYIGDETKGQVVETVYISVRPRKRPANFVYPSELFTLTINGTTLGNNVGYGEVAKWEDGNANGENRLGYFVNLSKNADNELIINKSTSTSVRGKYTNTSTNFFDNVYGVTIEGAGFASNLDEDKLDVQGKLLPQYACVCWFGCAAVEDNGQCIKGQSCMPNNNGIAVPSDNILGYKVLDRIDANHIYVFIVPNRDTLNYLQYEVHDLYNGLDTKLNLSGGTMTGSLVLHYNDGLYSVLSDGTSTSQILFIDEQNRVHVSSNRDTYIDGELSIKEPLAIEEGGTDSRTVDGARKNFRIDKVDNTADLDKPISNKTQAALDKKADIDANGLVPLSQLPSQVKERRVVNTIADRDAIKDKFENLQVYVKDATADHTVSKGGADYLYDGTGWIKTGEAESLDVVLSWDNVLEKPTEFNPIKHASTHAKGGSDVITPLSIDAADRNHTHTKADIGLGNVDNTSDANKPVSTATQNAIDAIIPFISGTQTSITGAWTGNASTIDALYDGLTIRYWLPYNGIGVATLNLTLKNGSTTGEKDCYYRGATRLNIQFPAGSLILLTYRENVSINGSTEKYTGWWATSDYNAPESGGSSGGGGGGSATALILTDEVTGAKYTLKASNSKLQMVTVE